ncbi:GNAT family N-acetyltransferase [soil metagenome]
MTVTIRSVRAEELSQYIESLSTAFFERPDVAKVAEEVRELWDLERTWAAFDEARLCGTFRSWGTYLTVPGGAQLPASAVSAVTVLPTHRRRGLLRSMATSEHGAIRERGEVFGLLYASEYPIYGRFGYGPACRVASWTLHTRDTSFHAQAPAGGVEVVSPNKETPRVLKAVFDAWRERQPGEIARPDYRWEFDLGRETAWGERWKGYLALRRNGTGEVDGYARYKAKEIWEDRQSRSTLEVSELHALNHDAYVGLWRFLAEMDLVVKVKAEGRTPSERLPWLLTNARAAFASDVGEGLWVRIFDVQRALEARSYEREGSVVLEVIDRELSDARQRFELDAGPAGASVRPTRRSAELSLDIAALSAAYLGGTRLRDAVLAHGADEGREGALAQADDLLRTRDEPWCSTFF